MRDAPSTLAEAAVWYCEHGFGIIPIAPRGKKPISEHGLNDWFDNPDDARKLWAAHPDLNIGIVCGVPSHGLVVLDVDEDDDHGKHGLDALNDWEDVRGELPSTAVAITGRGGLHYLYRTDRTNIRPSTNAELAVDVRADGGYIVAPPSIHPNGVPYRWQDGCAPWERPIATANGNVYDFLDHVQRNGGAEDGARPTATFDLPATIKQGERDDTLYRYACSLRHRGERDDVIQAMVEKANRDNCEKSLPQSDIDRIVRQACKHGAGHDGMGTMKGEPAGVGAFGASASPADVPPFRTDRGKIQPNKLARIIIDRNMARSIDGAPACWTGRRWEFGKAAFERLSIDYADDITRDQRNEVFAYIQSKEPSVSSDNGFDGRYYIQFANCTWDVMAEETVEPTPSMFIIGTLPIDLDLDAPYGDADRFIDNLAGGDEVTAKAMREAVGVCMCSRRAVQQSLFLIGKAGGGAHGSASNGKSTFINVMRSLLGVENVSSLDIATLGQRFQAAAIVGKIANLGDDIPDGFLKNDELSVFKKLVTGETIYTDVKNGTGFDFRPSATLVFSMNAMPRLADTTDGIFRRLAFIPFRRRFSPGTEGYDPHMAERMSQPENLRRLALLGLMELPQLIQRGAFTIIPDMAEEVEAIRMENDVVRRWLYEEMVEDTDLDDRWTDDVYREFAHWCDDAGEKYGASQAAFVKKVLATLATLEVVVTRVRAIGKQGRKFKLKSRVNVSE